MWSMLPNSGSKVQMEQNQGTIDLSCQIIRKKIPRWWFKIIGKAMMVNLDNVDIPILEAISLSSPKENKTYNGGRNEKSWALISFETCTPSRRRENN